MFQSLLQVIEADGNKPVIENTEKEEEPSIDLFKSIFGNSSDEESSSEEEDQTEKKEESYEPAAGMWLIFL